MKTISKLIILSASVFLATETASAQSLKDLLNKAANSETVKDIVQEATGIDMSAGINITGKWNYTGSAVKLESDDFLKNAAANLAVNQIESKLDEALGKVGIKAGMFTYTFKSDNTFATSFKNKTFEGTYTLSEDKKTIELKYGKILKSAKINATVSVSGNSLELLFKADKILELIGNMASDAENASIKSLGSIAGKYESMKIGFELQK